MRGLLVHASTSTMSCWLRACGGRHGELHGGRYSARTGIPTGMAWSICWLFILISVGSSEPGASVPITGIAIVDIDVRMLTVKRTERRVGDPCVRARARLVSCVRGSRGITQGRQ